MKKAGAVFYSWCKFSLLIQARQWRDMGQSHWNLLQVMETQRATWWWFSGTTKDGNVMSQSGIGFSNWQHVDFQTIRRGALSMGNYVGRTTISIYPPKPKSFLDTLKKEEQTLFAILEVFECLGSFTKRQANEIWKRGKILTKQT